ncbi:hypothetical protein C0J52_08043 [Blattella germanica]|nr:hypothetical protein C0J52_08043 [Blattella germanica]
MTISNCSIFLLSASNFLIYTILQNCTSRLVLHEACLALLSTNKTIAECSFEVSQFEVVWSQFEIVYSQFESV